MIAVVAASASGVIGRENEMPWTLSSDLKRFKRLTMGHPILMGRKTFQSIGRPLPGRRNLVLSSGDPQSFPAGVEVFPTIDHLLTAVSGVEKIYLIGGATLYDSLLHRCDQIMLTRVWTQTNGDTHLRVDLSGYRLIYSERVPMTSKDSIPTEFQIWKKQ
jgi:dihydrofolate reductase